jgi:ABC-type spermidine/putrescine transport system permease subunit II
MKKAYYSVLATLLVAMTSMANTNQGTEFQSLWDKMISYVQGLPGIMAALAILVVSLYMAFFGGKGPLVFFGGIIAAAAIFVIPNIVQGMGGSLF